MREIRNKLSETTSTLKISFKHQTAIFALFLILSLGLTYPLVMNMNGSPIGESHDLDRVAFMWNYWWIRHSLIDLHTNPFFTDYIFYPFTVDLRLHNLAPFYGLISLPVQSIIGVVGTFNIIALLTITLNGYTTYLLERHLVGYKGSAILAGALVAVNPSLTSHLRAGKAPFAAIWPVALALLLLSRLSQKQKIRDAIGLGLILLTALLIDFQILLYSALWLVLYGIYLLIKKPSKLLHRHFIIGTCVALLIVSIPFFGFFFPSLASADELGYPVLKAEATKTYSLNAKLFLSPWFLKVSFGIAFPLMVTIALISFPFIKRSRFWLIGGMIFLILTLGVVLQPTEIPLPYAWLRKLPGLAQFRTPYRFSIPATLGLALGIGVVLANLESRLTKSWQFLLTLVLLILILVDSRMVGPFMAEGFPDSQIYHRIAQDDSDSIILEIPVGVRSGTKKFGQGEELQYYQIIHGKPMINAMVARVPSRIFDYYRKSPSLRLLAGEKVPNEYDVEADFTSILRDWSIGYVIVHPKMLKPNLLEQIEGLLANRPELNLIDTTPDAEVYQVTHKDTAPPTNRTDD